MHRPLLTATLTIAEVLRCWPQAAKVFLTYQMACVGCVMASFDTLAEAAAVYDLPVNTLLDALDRFIQTEAGR